MNVLSLITQIFKPATELVDSLHTSEEEKLEQKAVLLKLQTDFLVQGLAFEEEQLQAKANIIVAEANSEHWLTAVWRPITMLSFVGMVGAYWFGLTPDGVTSEAVDGMFLLVQIGLGGYVVGRSAEKIVRTNNFSTMIEAFKKKEDT